MTTTQIKSNLHKYIDHADEHFLSALYAMMSEYMQTASPRRRNNEEEYTKPGKPMSLETLKKRVRMAEANIDAGEYTTHENLKKEMKKW